MSLLDYHEPESWRFYHYGVDENGEPLFSFWMNIDSDTGVCLYERNQGTGKWLSTHHSDEQDYDGIPPSEELKDVLRDVVSRGSVDSDRVRSLPGHERYFFQVVHGTIREKERSPPELLLFLRNLVDDGDSASESL